jgi:hypothetical protein
LVSRLQKAQGTFKGVDGQVRPPQIRQRKSEIVQGGSYHCIAGTGDVLTQMGRPFQKRNCVSWPAVYIEIVRGAIE